MEEISRLVTDIEGRSCDSDGIECLKVRVQNAINYLHEINDGQGGIKAII